MVSGFVVSNDAFCMDMLSAQVPLAARQKAKAQTAVIQILTIHPNFSPAAGCTRSVPTSNAHLLVARSFPKQEVRYPHILRGLLEIRKDRCCEIQKTCGFQWKKFLTLFCLPDSQPLNTYQYLLFCESTVAQCRERVFKAERHGSTVGSELPRPWLPKAIA